MYHQGLVGAVLDTAFSVDEASVKESFVEHFFLPVFAVLTFRLLFVAQGGSYLCTLSFV